jgi:hypothetical protein
MEFAPAMPLLIGTRRWLLAVIILYLRINELIMKATFFEVPKIAFNNSCANIVGECQGNFSCSNNVCSCANGYVYSATSQACGK